MGLYAKTLGNLEGLARSFDPSLNLLDEIKPLMTDLFRRQLLGDNPLETFLRTALDLKSLYLQMYLHSDFSNLLLRLVENFIKGNFTKSDF